MISVTPKALAQGTFLPATTPSTVYTVPTSNTAIIDKLTLFNSDAGAVTASIYIVPSGQTLSDRYLVIKDKSLAIGATADVTEMKNQILAQGDTIQAVASVGSKVSIRVSGREVA